MRREIKIVLPVSADPRRPGTQEDLDWAHQWLHSVLIDAFGGVSTYSGYGAWKAGDKTIHEAHKVYVCAVPWGAKERALTKSRLREMVQHLRYLAQQDCIYVVWPDGEAELVE